MIEAPVLEAKNVVKHYVADNGSRVRAVEGVSFSIAAGETLGLVGESGCGKSTLARVVMGLTPPTSGDVLLDGRSIVGLSSRAMRPLRQRMQMVFQDPYGSLNPRSKVARIVEEPLQVHRMGAKAARRARVDALLADVGLPADAGRRYPHEFSGGQRQRIGIARALALNPGLIVADEPVSALDVSIQAQVLNLLVRLQREHALSYLFVSHDLAVVQYIADRILVMYLGKIVETADHTRIWTQPLHPYTAGLLAAHPESGSSARRLRIGGDAPNPAAPPSGCRFHPRCPYAAPVCIVDEPVLRRFADGRAAACHFVEPRPDGSIGTPMDALPT